MDSVSDTPARKLVDGQTLMYGQEPTWTTEDGSSEDFKTRVISALNWANAVLTEEELKSEVLVQLDLLKKTADGVERLPSWKFSNIGKTAWLLNNGCPLDSAWRERFVEQLNVLLSDPMIAEIREQEKLKLVVELQKVSKVEQRQRQNLVKVGEIVGLVEDKIDDSVSDGNAVYQHLLSSKMEAKLVSSAYDTLTNKRVTLVTEIKDLKALTEDQVVDEFDDSETHEKYLLDLETQLVSLDAHLTQLQSFVGNKKALKKTSKKVNAFTAKRIEQQISKLNFKVHDSHYNVMSIPPASVLGAQTLIVFNTNTRKLGIYVAKDEVGLSIKGTTIQNFDDSVSVQKIIKKPEQLAQFQNGNIRRQVVLFKDIRAKASSLTGRINDETLLVKIFKEKPSF